MPLLWEQPSRAKAELPGDSPPPAPNSGVTAQDRRSAKGAVYTCGALLWADTPGCTPCWGLGQQRSGVKSRQQTPQQGCSAGNFPPWAICSCPSGQGRALGRARARTHTHRHTDTHTSRHHHDQPRAHTHTTTNKIRPLPGSQALGQVKEGELVQARRRSYGCH